MSGRRVVVLGAGVAGMTVAHELLQRRYQVCVLERRPIVGGKARSFLGRPRTHGGRELPFELSVEHGFHFFPGFYSNIDDTLKRIEVESGKTVYDSLIPAPEELFGFIGRPEIRVRSMAPETVADFQNILGFSDRVLSQGLLAQEDLEVFAQKIWQIATSCRARRDTEYEAVGWRSFVGSPDRSEQYYWYLANGLTRALVAAQGSKASTKTIGDVGLRILGQMVRFNGKTDRVLTGPANDVWFNPWIRFLEARFGKAFELRGGVNVTAIRSSGRRVTAVQIDGKRDLEADFFVSALPVEGLSPLLTSELIAVDPTLGGVSVMAGRPRSGGVGGQATSGPLAVDQSKYLRWMSGIQFFLREPLDMNRGHQMLLDSPWGLTSISQKQFWEKEYHRGLDDNHIGALLSVEISSWDVPGLGTRKTAAECEKQEEIAAETWRQVRAALPGQGLPPFESLVGWYLDDSVIGPNGPRLPGGTNGTAIDPVNLEPVVVNSAGAQALRPGTRTLIENFFLAGDFVKTDTDLACMEGANESGRRAANAVLDAAGDDESTGCTIAKPQDPLLTAPLRWMDETRFARNLPWAGLDMGKWIIRGMGIAKKITDAVFGDAQGEESSAAPIPASASEVVAAERAMPEGSDWDPRLDELRDSVDRLSGAGPDSADLVEAKKALAAAEDGAKWERLRDRLAPPQALRSVNNRSDSLFAKWRFFGTGRLRYFDPARNADFSNDGLEVPLPFQIYDADALVVHGSADLSYLKKQMEGTGLAPVCDQNGQGYVEVWIMDYPDACVGPHREAAIHVVAADSSTPRGGLVYDRQDAFGCDAPAMNPSTKLFTLSILLSDMRAIAYGEQMFGIGKHFVASTFAREGAVKSFTFADRSRETGEVIGSPFFRGRIVERDGMAREVISLAALAQAVGTIEVARDMWQTIEMDTYTATMVGRQLPDFKGASKGLVEILADYKISSTMTPVTSEDHFDWTTKHEFGRCLKEMRFEPLLLARDRHLRSVLYARNWLRAPQRLEALAYASDTDQSWLAEGA